MKRPVFQQPIAVAARSKACVYGLLLTGSAGSNCARDVDVGVLCLLFVVLERCGEEPIIRPEGPTDCVI
jgi:hypothetical protein